MIVDAQEQEIIDNSFGTVTSKRVIYSVKKGLFSGKSREDIPLKQIVSVRYEVTRKTPLGLFLIIIGIPLLIVVIGIIPLVRGINMLRGIPTVNITTAGGTSNPVTGEARHKKEAEAFATTLRDQLVHD